MTSSNSLFDLRVLQISQIKWGSAVAWDESCDSLVKEYYFRILTWWPAERHRLPPNDQIILKQLSAQVALNDSILVSDLLNSALFRIRENGIRVERATIDLLKIILNFALAFDNRYKLRSKLTVVGIVRKGLSNWIYGCRY